MGKRPPDRDWSLALLKREREGDRCRVCRSAKQVQMAHVWRREADHNDMWGKRRDGRWVVMAERVVPLCKMHHDQYDTKRLDLLGYLTPQEEAQLVIDARGLENARIRICPSAYRRVAA